MRNAPLDEAFSQIHRRGLGAPCPAQGCPSGTTPPAGRGRTWAIHPAALSRLLRGVASRDQPQGNPPYHAGSRRWTRLSLGVGHGLLFLRTLLPISRTFFDAFFRTFSARFASRDSAADQPVRHRWGLASRRLRLGAESLVFRSPVTPAGAGGTGLVPVASGDRREPHRRPGRWGSPCRLPRFGKRGCAALNVTLGVVRFLCTRRSLSAADTHRHPLNLVRAFP